MPDDLVRAIHQEDAASAAARTVSCEVPSEPESGVDRLDPRSQEIGPRRPLLPLRRSQSRIEQQGGLGDCGGKHDRMTLLARADVFR